MVLVNEISLPNKKLTATQSIKFYCKEVCCLGDQKSWKFCSATRCPLYPYRLGKRPKKHELTTYLSQKNTILGGRGDASGNS
jgi:hypothetical protein|tara:strand:+ start:647 stop:892 length:246 start_codon:yes stop_codon:yes gene_type:complete